MVDSGRQIGFEQLGIGSVLSRNKILLPPNQREYSWTEREVNDLFHDLGKAISDNAPEYFLGSIVAMPRSPGVLEVVDGQQRLATIAILLAAMRDVLKGRVADKLLVESIENSIIPNTKLVQTFPLPCQRSTTRDRETYGERLACVR